ncbi:hypothetical protein [Paenibacillus harenae]|uniref:hypothetical protein n=1 Tax=Paenibacillus harenae TaxID=306543 RepID=UPI0027920C03|nr:hypothetical protein [Paenibacillus harenae]MDQ0063881.1 putative membrane protein [Paenibacillus harenae]
MNKSALAAFWLSFIPGVGHGYLGRPVRFVLYGGSFFGILAMIFLFGITGNLEEEWGLFGLFIMTISWLINMIDMLVTLFTGRVNAGAAGAPPVLGSYPGHGGMESSFNPYEQQQMYRLQQQQQQEKTRTILLSFLPGLGHMSLGLMQRGITFLISFIGLFAIIVFLSVIMGKAVLLIFLLGLPIIWIYSLFDAIQQLHAKQRGESMEDRAVFEELEAHIASGRKSKVLAIALSIFPGAGHLYLGLQKRGLQLMGGFLLTIYIMDNLRLSLFFFLLPLFWCFAFFDALQQTSRYERQTLSDEPILTQLVPYQRWFGFALLSFGVYYLLDRVAAEAASRYSSEIYTQYLQFKYMIPTAVIAFVMIIVGMRLVFGGKTYSEGRQDTMAPPPPPPYSKQEEEIQ